MDPSRKPLQVQWEGGRFLGKGQYGTVSLGVLVDGCSRTPLAVKSATTERSWIALIREKMFLDLLRGCPQVISCYGYAVTATTANGEERIAYNIFLEYAPGGSLHDYLRLGPMHERLARRLTRSILRGLAHIHRHGVAHCDIKPANIMVCGTDEVKIIDFGLALLSPEWNVSGVLFRGTAYYLAPECITRKEYGAAADVWAVGCTLAEMLTRKPARAYLDNVPGMEFLSMIGKGQALPEIPEHMSKMGRAFLSRCFELDSRKRWTAEMLLSHPYMAGEDYDHHSS